jgi:RNA polymerase sigma factor (sigma-70 family)
MRISTSMRRDHRLSGLAGPRLLAREPDERLVELARAGDEAAFDAIVERYRAQVLRQCLGYLPPSAAEDAAQQTFINAHRALARGDSDAPVALRAWLYRVARNAALNIARGQRIELVELPKDLDGVERPEDVALSRDRLVRVFDAVRALPLRQRDVMVRHAIDGESHESIAADLGLSVNAIRQLAYRARKAVRTAAAGVVPAPLLRWLQVADSAPTVDGGAIAVKAALITAVVAGGGGAVELSTHAASHARHDRPWLVHATRTRRPASLGASAAPSGHTTERAAWPVAVPSRSSSDLGAGRHPTGRRKGSGRGDDRMTESSSSSREGGRHGSSDGGESRATGSSSDGSDGGSSGGSRVGSGSAEEPSGQGSSSGASSDGPLDPTQSGSPAAMPTAAPIEADDAGSGGSGSGDLVAASSGSGRSSAEGLTPDD